MNDPADWDDTLILNVFRESIASHRRQNDPQNATHDSLSKETPEPANSGLKRKREGKAKEDVAQAPFARKLQRGAEAASNYYSSNTRQHLFAASKESSQAGPATESAPESGVEAGQTYPASYSFPSLPSSAHPLLDDALQTMLMAWYQCGYATARYQTLAECGYSHLNGEWAESQPAEATDHAPAKSSPSQSSLEHPALIFLQTHAETHGSCHTC